MSMHTISDTEARLAHIKEWEEYREKIRQEGLAELSELFKETVLTNIQEWCKAPEQREKIERYITRLFSSENIEHSLIQVLDKSENGSLKWNIPPSKYSCYGLNERKKDVIVRRWLLKQTYRETGAAWKISGTRAKILELEALRTIYKRVIVKIISNAWVRDNQPPWLEQLYLQRLFPVRLNHKG
jgi:hypothetical protein